MGERTQDETTVSAAASGLAIAILKEAHAAGKDIHIPSLGITIPGKVVDAQLHAPGVAARPLAEIVDDYEFAIGLAGDLGGVELT